MTFSVDRKYCCALYILKLICIFLQIFSDLLVYINSSTNFLIFAVMGKRFREVMMQQLCKTKKRRRKAAQLASMASLELIRSLSELTLRTSTAAAGVQSCHHVNENNNKNPGLADTDLSRLHKINNIINSKLSRLYHVNRSFQSLARRHSWTLETSGENFPHHHSANENQEAVSLRKVSKRRSSEPNTSRSKRHHHT